MRRTALTIAGSDSSGGAGIQADIKTMLANGVYAMSAVTALTAQNTRGVTGIMEVTPEFLGEQLDNIFTDIRPGFVATPLLHDGRRYPMLLTPEYVAARIVRALERGKRRVTIDRRYAVLVFLWRLIPAALWARLPIRNRPARER